MSTIRKLTPAFCAVIDEAARKAFGNLPIVNYRTGFKYLKNKPIGPLLVNHYMPDFEGMFRKRTEDFTTELEDRSVDRKYRLKTRGKGPPKKGHGKRASKKK
jgi:hypothetical protein